MRRWVIALVACSLMVLSSCTSSGDAGPTSPAGGPSSPVEGDPPAGITLTFIQTRSLEGSNRAQVRVTNETSQALDVREVGLDWPGFPGGTQSFPYLVEPGLTLDLPYDLPEPDCAASAGRAPAYVLATTAQLSMRQPMPADGMRFLSRLWRTACAAQEVARVVAVRYGDTWTRRGRGEDSVLAGRLILTRGPEPDPVEVTSVKGSVLFALSLPGAAHLPAGADRVSLPLEVRRGRCDEHGRSQSTQTFVWRVWLRLGDREPVSQIVPLTTRQQVRMQGFLDLACAGHVKG